MSSVGSAEQIQAVIDAGLVPAVLRCMTHDEFSIRKEAVWVISNMTDGGTEPQLRYLLEQVLGPCDSWFF
jgi:importin subunit alpha-1